MAKAKKDKATKKKGGTFRLVLFMLVCCALAIFLKAAFMFILIGMLPSIAAYIADTSKGRELYRTVLSCNIAGLLPYAANMAAQPGHGIESFAQLSNPMVWFAIYSAALGGYILVWACPHLAESVTEISNKTRIARLEYAQKQLLEEWGPEIQRRN